MANSTPLRNRGRTRDGSRNGEKGQRFFREAIRPYRFEISVALLLATGFFFLIEQFEIKHSVYSCLVPWEAWRNRTSWGHSYPCRGLHAHPPGTI